MKARYAAWVACGPWSLYSGLAATPAGAYDILSRGQDGHLLLASPPGGDRLSTLLPTSRAPRPGAEGGPRSHAGRYDGPWVQPPALPADRSGPLGHPPHRVETRQGVQGAAAGDPAPVRSLAALRGAPRDFCGHERAHRPPGAVTRPAAWPSRRTPAGPLLGTKAARIGQGKCPRERQTPHQREPIASGGAFRLVLSVGMGAGPRNGDQAAPLPTVEV